MAEFLYCLFTSMEHCPAAEAVPSDKSIRGWGILLSLCTNFIEVIGSFCIKNDIVL